MKSLLFSGTLPFSDPPGCETGRQEAIIGIQKDGLLFHITVRDKVAPEDPYLVLLKAEAFAIRQGEAFAGTPPPRSLRDYLIKSNVTI